MATLGSTKNEKIDGKEIRDNIFNHFNNQRNFK